MGRQTAVVAAMLLMVPNTNSCVSFRWAMSSYIKREFGLSGNTKKPLHGVSKAKIYNLISILSQ